MLPIRLIETEREDFDGPIVELWRDDDFVGLVFWDGESTILQVYPDGEGDVHDLDVRELQMLLDTALRIVDPDAFDTEMDELRDAVSSQEWGDEHPATSELLADYDELARHRSEDGEAFFPKDVAGRFIRSCDELDLAVMEMEGLDLVDDQLKADQSLVLETAEQPMMTWSQFRAFANTTAQHTLAMWPERESLVVAFVFRQPDGADIVA
ncbi:MAG: hypothetical protein QNJ71_07590 [Acidimicrobiia bacterium]|nr:hypothetical protein [Acidimicrobiia bacterium]